MLAPSLALVLLASAGLVECRSFLNVPHSHGGLNFKRQNEDATGTTLVANAIQSGSFADGSKDGVITPGQAASKTSQSNFINNCSGKTLTDGLQVIEGSCNGIPMGDIPSKQNMVSSIITFPLAGSNTIEANTTFQISVQMINFVAGSFTNAQKTYYSAPQELQDGKIVGHTHVTVQDLGDNLNPKQPLDATKFVFFKGINDKGDGNGLLSATITGGLPVGNYRVCTMASSSNHQPVLSPVAQRGAQDDCTKFSIVTAGGGQGGNGGNGGNGNGDASSSSAETAPVVTPVAISSTTASLSSSVAETTSVFSTQGPFANTTIAAVTTRRGGGGKGGKPGKTTKAAVTTKAGGGKSGKPTKAAVTTKASGGKPAKTTKAAVTTKAAGGKGGNGNQAPPPPKPTKIKNNNGGKGQGGKGQGGKGQGGKGQGGKGQGGKPVKSGIKGVKVNTRPTKVIKIVRKVTIIRTFFSFTKHSLGGLPPSVGKKGNLFSVLDQLFDSLPKACQAACSKQWLTCISFSGPGFEITQCEIQRTACKAAAAVVPALPPAQAITPPAVTATVTVPPSVSVPGTIIGEETISSTVDLPKPTAPAEQVEEVKPTNVAPQAQPSADPVVVGEVVPPVKGVDSPAATAAPVAIPSPVEDGNVACSLFTKTVTVDPTPAPTLVVDKQPFSNSTIPSVRRM